MAEKRDMVQIGALEKFFGEDKERVHVLKGVTLNVPEGSLYTFLGPSGCGKTTTLRCVAGLERPDGGKISIRRAGRMHHLGIGADHRGKRVLAIADDHTITVVHLDTAEVIATNQIDPTRNYWRNTQKAPGRWPGAF